MPHSGGFDDSLGLDTAAGRSGRRLCLFRAAAAPPPPAPKQTPVARPAPPKLARHIPEEESDIARTFDSAVVMLPGRGGGQSRVAKMNTAALQSHLSGKRGRRYPTVLYMHACTGLKNLPALRAMARRGFAIVAPGSFARRFRPKQCDARSPRGGRSRYVFDFRQAESNYALTRM